MHSSYVVGGKDEGLEGLIVGEELGIIDGEELELIDGKELGLIDGEELGGAVAKAGLSEGPCDGIGD